MTDYAKLAKDLHERNIGTYVDVGDTSVPAYPYDHLSEAAATALETLLRERDEARLQCDGLEERGDLALKELNEARLLHTTAANAGLVAQRECDRLTAENARLRDKAENVVIAHGMGWDMDGVIEALKDVLPEQEEADSD